jgi:glycosyltransferase 2 family protein
MDWKKFITWVLVLVAFAFLGHFMWSSWGELQGFEFSLDWSLFLLSYPFVLAHFILVALGWGLLLRRLRPPGIPLLAAVKIRTVADFGRFVPGKIWLVLGRVEMARKYGLPSEVVAFSALMEIAVNQLGAILVFVLAFLFTWHDVVSWYAVYALVLLPIPLFFLHRRFFNPLMKLAAKWLKRDYVKSKVPFWYMLALLSVFVTAWFSLGIGFYLMVASLYPVSLSLLPTLAAGLGFREAVLSYLLAFFLPLPIAILVAVLARLWMVAGELCTAFLFSFKR